MRGEGGTDRQGDAIVLIGVSGSGKSTIAKRLAPALDATFLEGDDYHSLENISKMRSGTPLTDDDRWPWLDKLGHAVAAQRALGRPVVVACSALRRAYRDRLRKAAGCPLTFIHLIINPAVIRARMKARRQHFMPTALLDSQLATLEPLQPDENGMMIFEAGSVLQTVQTIGRWLHTREEGRVQSEGLEGDIAAL